MSLATSPRTNPMDEKRILDIFTAKLMTKDFPEYLLEAHAEITIALIAEVLGQEGLKAMPSESWQVIKRVVEARSQLTPFIALSKNSQYILVAEKASEDLIHVLNQMEYSVRYVIKNYDSLGHSSDFHKLWSRDKIQLALEELLKHVMKKVDDAYRVPSDNLKLVGKLLSLILYVILDKKNYDQFCEESKKAMKILSRYRHQFASNDKDSIN